jgi:hypothetical protein
MKKLHAKSKADFVAEADGKARLWWIQSGNSEAAKVNSDWFEAAKKRAAAGGGLSLCKPPALAVVLKTALSFTSEAPCERDLTERRKRILQHREQRKGAR